MSKLKVVLLIILAVVLVDFVVENTQPSPMLRFFKFDLVQLPTYLLAYASLILGLIVGWVGHALRIRKKRRERAAAAASAATQEQQEPQSRPQGQGQ